MTPENQDLTQDEITLVLETISTRKLVDWMLLKEILNSPLKATMMLKMLHQTGFIQPTDMEGIWETNMQYVESKKLSETQTNQTPLQKSIADKNLSTEINEKEIESVKPQQQINTTNSSTNWITAGVVILVIGFLVTYMTPLGRKEPTRMWHESQLRHFAFPCIKKFYISLYPGSFSESAVLHHEVTHWNRYEQAVPYKGNMKMQVFIDTGKTDRLYDGYVSFEELPDKKMKIILKDWTSSNGNNAECSFSIGDEKPFGPIIDKH